MANSFFKIFRLSTLFKLISIAAIVSLLLAYIGPYVHPRTLGWLPFFGLAYPISFVGALILLIGWTLIKSKWAFSILIIILLGGTLPFRIFVFGSDEEPQNLEHSLKIVSNNVHIFELYNENPNEKYKVRDSIIGYFEKVNPDVICMQEFYRKDLASFQTKELFINKFGIKGYHERVAHKNTGRQSFGIVILSKYPIVSKGNVNFEVEGEKNYNYCIFSDIVKGQDTFRIYNVHLQSIKIQNEDIDTETKSAINRIFGKLNTAYAKRADQALKVVEHAQSSPYPVVICGDFNDTPVSYCYSQFARKFTDAWRSCGFGIGSTFAGKIPAGRIDYIFHSPNLKSSGFQIQEKPFSDHRAISCTISK